RARDDHAPAPPGPAPAAAGSNGPRPARPPADATSGAALADRLGRYLPEEQPIALDPVEELAGTSARAARKQSAAARRAANKQDADRAVRPWGVELGGVDLAAAPLGDVRRTIFLHDAKPAVFAGTLQRAIDPEGALTRARAGEALAAAAAQDVYESVPGGWQGVPEERGRGLSGGQRQRLVLARTYAARPPILILVEPTSAVDAHTEVLIAERLPQMRRGQTTIVVTSSPVLLHRADEVVLLQEGRAAARGTHVDLLGSCPDYRNIVLRGGDVPTVKSARDA